MEAFREWFAPVLRDAHKSGDADAEKFAHSVEWEFADFSHGRLSEVLLKENLARLASVALRRQEPRNSDVPVDTLYFPVRLPQATMVDQSSVNGGSGSTNGMMFYSFRLESSEASPIFLSDLVLTFAG